LQANRQEQGVVDVLTTEATDQWLKADLNTPSLNGIVKDCCFREQTAAFR